MRASHLPRPGRRPASDQRPSARPCGAAPGTGRRSRGPPFSPQTPAIRVTSITSFRAQRGQQGGQPLQGERLPAARRPDQQQAVRAGRGDLEAAAERGMAAQIGEVGQTGLGRSRRGSAGGTGSISALRELAQLG